MEKSQIKGLGYRELKVLAEILNEIAEHGSYKNIQFDPELEIYYNSHYDTIEIDDGETSVMIEVATGELL